MFLSTALTLLALATSQVLALVTNSTNNTTSNPSRYVQVPIYRQGPVNDPASGYYWIDLGFGNYTASCIVDSGKLNSNFFDHQEVEIFGLLTSKVGIEELIPQRIIKSTLAGISNTTLALARIFSTTACLTRRSGNWGTEDITLPGGLVAKDVLFGDATSPGAGSGFMGVRLSSPLTS